MQLKKLMKILLLITTVTFIYHGEVQAMDSEESSYNISNEEQELVEEPTGDEETDIKESTEDGNNSDLKEPENESSVIEPEEKKDDVVNRDIENNTNNINSEELNSRNEDNEKKSVEDTEEIKEEGWKNKDGKTYYYVEGEKYTGELYEKGYWYFFDPDTGEMKKDGFAYLRDNKKWCYYNKLGQMIYGEAYLNAGWYYLTPGTGAVTYEFQYLPTGNKWVYYGIGDGRMRYGEQYINEGWYYLTPGTGAVDYEWSYIPTSNKWVYYDSVTGRMQYGQHKIQGKWYYFDDCTGRVLSENEIANKLVQIAYSELHKNTNVVEAIRNAGGIVCPYGPCMTFVWYVFNKAGLSGFLCDGAITGYPHHNYDWYNCRGKINWSPKAGDIVFFRWNGWADSIGASASHAGIVVGVNGGYVQVIDAMADGLGPHYYSLNDYALRGYANPFI